MLKVFISYARDQAHGGPGENLATEAQQQLQSAGFEVFRDVIGLKPGDVWYSKLEFELETSDVVVLIVSERVRRSKWVHNEISMAEEIGLPVIPVFAETIRSPLWLRHLQALNFTEAADWPVLIKTVASHPVLNTSDDAAKITTQPSQQPVVLTPTKASSIKDSLLYQRDQCRERTTWASELDIDNFGIYADLNVAGSGVTQRFRLIQSGTFWMGSLGTEAGHRDNETRHQVTLSKAFWLADTACTQALCETVMGTNPSNYKDNKNNPVEQVSWNDIQEFTQTLNAMQSGLSVQLPTEAQWEYACRAGSSTPFCWGWTD